MSVLEKEIDQHQGVRAYIFLYALFQLTYDLLEMPRVDLCKFNYRLDKTEEDVLNNYEHQMRFFIHATVDNTLRYIKVEHDTNDLKLFLSHLKDHICDVMLHQEQQQFKARSHR